MIRKMNKTYLESNDITKLENEATNLRDKLLIRLLFHLGCRISEALALKVEDIDLDAGTVTILHLKTKLSLSCPACGTNLGRSHCFCPKCGAKVLDAVTEARERRRLRTIPIDSETGSMLADFIKRDKTQNLIFRINRHRAWQIISGCARKAGLPDLINPESGKTHHVSPHKLRDAFAVNAVKTDDSGDGLRMLQVHLGHTSFNTTAKYRKVSGDEQKAWYERLWENRK